MRNDRGLFGREARPVVSKGSVILDPFAKEPRIHVRMENGRAVRSEFSHRTFGAPIDERITVREDLSATLRLGQESIGGLERLNNPSGPSGRVDGYDLTLREGVCVDLVTAVIFCPVGGVVEE